jgi:hypothetical protein
MRIDSWMDGHGFSTSSVGLGGLISSYGRSWFSSKGAWSICSMSPRVAIVQLTEDVFPGPTHSGRAKPPSCQPERVVC